MLLTLSYAAPAATDLGFLLHKHPAKLQTFAVSVGQAHVFYPEATDDRCTVALLLEIDPIALVRNRRFGGKDSFALGSYVNDRPYASSSMLSVAIGGVFRTAMTGRSDTRPELAASPLDLEIGLTSVPGRGHDDLAHRLFEPLGWHVLPDRIPLDPEFPEWGGSRYLNLRLSGRVRLSEALRHLYVLLPVLDDSKHYWVGDDEVGKLLRAGEGWLTDHPERDFITRRYLAHQRSMVADATARLAEIDGLVVDSTEDPAGEESVPVSPLYELRAESVLQALRDCGAKTVADLGCGEGALLKRLVADPSFTTIIGTDVSARTLSIAAARLHLDERSNEQHERIRLLQSSLTYEDPRVAGLDAAVLMEVIEHIEPDRLDSVENSVFGVARPASVIVTTPNAEYNTLFEKLEAGTMRHPDHRFEWGRAEFSAWAERVSATHGYTVEFRPVGAEDPALGPPTQLALFRRAAG